MPLHGTTHLKRCTKCGEEKPATTDFFYREPRGKFGLRSICKTCRADQARAYYAANKEALAEYHRAYYVANREALAEYQRAYQVANKEALAAYHRAYREANRERIAEYHRAYYVASKAGCATTAEK